MNQEVEISAIDAIRGLLDELARWETHIRQALNYSRHTHSFNDVVRMVLNNEAFFYSWDKSFVLMELINYPRCKVWHCFLAGGELPDVLASIEPMKQLARELGCSYVSVAGREGWKREFSKLGWEFACTTMFCAVEVHPYDGETVS